MNLQRVLCSFAVTAACLVGCASACKKPAQGGEEGGEGQKQEIEVKDGMVRFYLSAEKSGTRTALGITPEVFNAYTLRVNGTESKIEMGSDGRFYSDVMAVTNDTYNASLAKKSATAWSGTSPYSDLRIPTGQFADKTPTDMKDYPLFASYKKDDGNVLNFTDGFSVLDLTLKGSASLASIKISAESGGFLSGKGSFLPSKEEIRLSEGLPFVVLNCFQSGVATALKTSGRHFPILIAPGSYGNVTITIVDSDHRVMTHSIPSLTIGAGEAEQISLEWKPDEKIIWYEGFDNFVWGGDVMKGSSSTGYAPDGTTVEIDGAAARTGYEYALTRTTYNNPGSGYIQPNNWDQVSGKSVGAVHHMSESYINSRGLADWATMFRAQEYQGVLSVATTGQARGIVSTPCIGNIESMANVKVSFDFCFQNGIQDNLLFRIIQGGEIVSVTVDGVSVPVSKDNLFYEANGSNLIFNHSSVTVPSSLAQAKEWHRLECLVKGATDGTKLYFAGNSSSAMVHGFWLDNLTVTLEEASSGRTPGSIRLLYWNIQNGMWADQANNYDNFVKWVKKYDPDICVWCEASSIYKDNTNSSAASSARFLPSGWTSLAARYGHPFAATGGFRDNYPQEITSKYPISTLLKITDSNVSGKPVSHGAAIQQVTVSGKTINFVTAHMWPQAYGYGVSGDTARETSSAAHEGDYYRQFEMDYIVKNTINSGKYTCDGWVLLGDFNSRSRLDNGYYKYAEDNTLLITQDVVLQNTDLKDVIHETHPDAFIASTYGTARIDFVYLSPSLMPYVDKAIIVMDKWTDSKVSTYVSSFRDPSDHRPILVDFIF